MFNIAQFLQRFEKLGASSFLLRKSVAEAIKEVLGVDVLEKDIEIKEGVARVSGNPMFKQSLYIKKGMVIEKILGKGGKIKDIR